MAAVDTYSAASAVCRTASVMFGPCAPDWFPWWLRDQAETVLLPEPAELARLLESSAPASHPRTPDLASLGHAWEQPALFDMAAR